LRVHAEGSGRVVLERIDQSGFGLREIDGEQD
jgi:hypothetical protein